MCPNPKHQNNSSCQLWTYYETYVLAVASTKKNHEWGFCHCGLLSLMRENPLKISSCYAGACFLLCRSLSLLSPLGKCLHTEWKRLYTLPYYKVYFGENRREMIWNDLCPLSERKIAEVIGFVFKRHSLHFIFYVLLAAGSRCFLPLQSALRWLDEFGSFPPPLQMGRVGVKMIANKGD